MGIKKHNLTYLILSDLYRYHGRISIGLFCKELLFGIGFKYSFWLRLCRHFKYKSKWFYPVFLFCWLMVRRNMFKFGIQINYGIDIGSGFYIGHFGTIIISSSAIIGKNCNISQGVTIGKINLEGGRTGAPVIGDNVYIGPGAKLIGNIIIGDNVAIGANAVVTKDAEPGVIVAGVPAKVISKKGSFGYISHTDYDVLFASRSCKES